MADWNYISVARRKESTRTRYTGSVMCIADWEGVLPLDFLEKHKAYTATVYEDDEAGRSLSGQPESERRTGYHH